MVNWLLPNKIKILTVITYILLAIVVNFILSYTSIQSNPDIKKYPCDSKIRLCPSGQKVKNLPDSCKQTCVPIYSFSLNVSIFLISIPLIYILVGNQRRQNLSK
jgi:hypothetical protein